MHSTQNLITINGKINERLLNSTVRYVIGTLFFQLVKLEGFPFPKSSENHLLLFFTARFLGKINVSITASHVSNRRMKL